MSTSSSDAAASGSSSMIVDDGDHGTITNSNSQQSILFSDIVNTILYVIRGAELNQPRLLHRAVKQNACVRRFITSDQLEKLIKKYIPADWPTYEVMMNTVVDKLPKTESTTEEKDAEMEVSGNDDGAAMAVDAELSPDDIDMDIGGSEKAKKQNTAQQAAAAAANAPPVTVFPELEVYIFTLVVTTLLRHSLFTEAAFTATALVERIRCFNRRSLDVFSSKAYFYLSLSYERVGRLEAIRPTLLTLYRTACIRRDDMGQAVLLNLLLRNYLHYNLIEQAHTLSVRAVFPETASNNQFCRYLYYMGRIQAVQLEYSESFQRLMVAARKAPQGYAAGFTRMVHKLVVIVQLLMGDIPERSLFNQPELRVVLQPYLELTQAVRTGDLVQFNSIMERHAASFRTDGNLSLVQRLGHNVLKTGLRKISVSYSRISLADVAEKLHLPSAAAAEYICAKAIRDGVIEAKLDHDSGSLSSHEVLDLYGTEEPQRAFHKRIAFCLDVHNEAVKSMRYPPEELYRKELRRRGGKGDGKDEDKDKQDEKTIEELIKEMEEDMDE